MSQAGKDDNVFHQHLDVCKRCREQPFNLCREGARTLRLAVQESANDILPKVAPR